MAEHAMPRKEISIRKPRSNMYYFAMNMNFKKLSLLFISLSMISNNAHTCDSFVTLSDDGDLRAMTSGDPRDCPKVNAHEMIEDRCELVTESTTSETDRWLVACREYLKPEPLTYVSFHISLHLGHHRYLG
jgi:hypothetical protein